MGSRPLPDMGQFAGKSNLGQELVRDGYMGFHDSALLLGQCPPGDGKHGVFILCQPGLLPSLRVRVNPLPDSFQPVQAFIRKIARCTHLQKPLPGAFCLLFQITVCLLCDLPGQTPDLSLKPDGFQAVPDSLLLKLGQPLRLVHNLQRGGHLADIMEPYTHDQLLPSLGRKRNLLPSLSCPAV